VRRRSALAPGWAAAAGRRLRRRSALPFRLGACRRLAPAADSARTVPGIPRTRIRRLRAADTLRNECLAAGILQGPV